MFVRGPGAERAPMGGRAPFARSEPPAPDLTGGILGALDRFCSVLPARLKLQLSEQVISWATTKREDARRALGIQDEPEPAPPAASSAAVCPKHGTPCQGDYGIPMRCQWCNRVMRPGDRETFNTDGRNV